MRAAMVGRRAPAALPALMTYQGLVRRFGQGTNRYRQERMREKRQKVAQFAECLADGMNITAAARACGVSQQTGSLYLKQIIKDLGWQAR